MDYEPERKTLAESRISFGQVLKRWRHRSGWSGKTPGHWYKAAPEILRYQVASATWTNFELGRAIAPAPETFLALENMNTALSTGDVGNITDRQLRDRIKAAKPICDSTGKPWDAIDFFAAFIGRLDAPDELCPSHFDGHAAGHSFVAMIDSLAKRHSLGRLSVLLQVMRHMRNSTATDHAAVESVIMFGAPFPNQVVADMATDALSEWALESEDFSGP